MNLNELSPAKSKKINKVLESRFGFEINYNKLTLPKAIRLSTALTESLVSLKRTYGAHTAEKNAKYMEMLLVRESLNDWINSQEMLVEGELETAEVVLAAKDMVDTVQDMITDASKMQNEELPPLLDSIRDQVGTAEADAFESTVTSALQGLMEALKAARDALDSGARVLAGEQQPMAQQGAGMAQSAGQPAEMPAEEPSGFDAADAAAGGAEEMGRERR
jgi:paraquat-inducible protein B